MALHKDLTGANLHEPKGITTATASQVYRADGVGSGSWQTITIPSGTFKITRTVFSSSGTWTKPANLFGVNVHVIGGSGGASQGGTAGAGGTSSVGVLASVGGSAAKNSSGNGAGGSTGTTPSGGLSITGNAGNAFFGLVTDNDTAGSVSTETVSNITMAPGPFGSASFGAGVVNASGGNAPAASGSGAYCTAWIPTASLGATETITVGAAGAGTGGTAGIKGWVLMEEYITV